MPENRDLGFDTALARLLNQRSDCLLNQRSDCLLDERSEQVLKER